MAIDSPPSRRNTARHEHNQHADRAPEGGTENFEQLLTQLPRVARVIRSLLRSPNSVGSPLA